MRSTPIRNSVSGALAAALALGVAELLAGLVASLPSMVEGLGTYVINNVPKPIKDFAIAVFGTADKLALLIGIAVVTVLIGAVIGIFAKTRFGIAAWVFSGFAVVAALASAADPRVSLAIAIIPAGAAAITGLAALQWLYGLGEPPEISEAESEEEDGAGWSRRTFVAGAGAVLGMAAIAGATGRFLVENAKRAVAGRGEVVLPGAAEPLPAVPEAAELGVEGLTPVIVPNEDFYRIDTAFAVPSVNIKEWTTEILGRVDRPYKLTYSDLMGMRMVERDVTLSCVSNQVGGDLVGNARWLGVPLSEILDRAQPRDDAEQLVARSVDDFTVGFPVEAVYDGREALLAVGMNGEPLPFEHGFPARLVVAGLYGYVSATKWLSKIELTGWETFDAYWIPRGWAKEAPIKTQSRIDTPRPFQRVTTTPRKVAGVAWAPTRGISKVEVQIGEGAEWQEAELSEPLSVNSWIQWQIDWPDPRPGQIVIRCRATDGNGDLQTGQIAPPAPDGATGWHGQPVEVLDA